MKLGFLFDTTGSMRPASLQVMREVKAMANQLYKAIPDVEIFFAAHGDFCDYDNYIVKWSPSVQSRDIKVLETWLSNLTGTGGGDWRECYGYAMQKLSDHIVWDGDDNHLIMIGDASPHREGHTYSVRSKASGYTELSEPSWESAQDSLNAQGVTVHTIQALTTERESPWWNQLAKRNNGTYTRLGQFGDTVIAITATALRHTNDDALVDYTQKLGDAGQLDSYQRQDMLEKILLGSGAAGILDGFKSKRVERVSLVPSGGLKPIEGDYFQVLEVGSSKTVIADFVRSTGALFQTGRGFYEFNAQSRRTTLRPNREVVLRDKVTGEFWAGTEARNMIGVPVHEKRNISYYNVPWEVREQYDVFIQSTSANRKLEANSLFLYKPKKEAL